MTTVGVLLTYGDGLSRGGGVRTEDGGFFEVGSGSCRRRRRRRRRILSWC